MHKLRQYLLVISAVFGTILSASGTTWAEETSATAEVKTESLVAITPEQPIENTIQENVIAQVTSVSQLSDVQPTDWAFQALQSLVERYGCIAGYPNSTYRGNRALTRYEFAAGLNACLDRVNELIATATSELVTKQDLAALQKLQEEFSAELATLRGRVDAVEARTAELEANQFSTTTKLSGVVVIAPISVFAGDNANGDRIERVPFLGDRVRLDLNTSFTGEDLLRTRLQATNLNALSSSTLTPEGDLRFTAGTFSADNNNEVAIDALLYSFPLGEKTTVVLEANAGAADDFTNTVNPFFDGDGDFGALSNFGTRNPIYYPVAGSGIGVRHEFSDKLELTLGYLASTPNDPTPGNGLFDGAYGAIGQLTVKPIEGLTLGFTYVNSYNADLTAGSNRANLRTALATNPALVGFLGEPVDLPISSNSYGIQASFQFSPKIAIGGWVGYTNTRTLSEVTTDAGTIPRGELDIWNYAVTLAFPDLGKPGSVGGIIVGMEPKVTGASNGIRNAIGTDSDTSLHIEGFYQYKLSDNITITPGVIWLTAPDHNNDNDDIVVGTIRTTFTF
ncbi:iron uptake porin [Nostoc sp. FACHB-152]|uniref:iron uptake porin n=1 Tax=unclassified Nostoc TaxID=2593658 RepID=UPI001681F3CC|nr:MULTISPECIES: iron uptake porin [unclassified Nostoc]MBD2450830.1 iron uptake porin [Nostoc sp. FACHB-152]MBD2471978.1 iron uptake porin [Nostoc sp. FACHB-145]